MQKDFISMWDFTGPCNYWEQHRPGIWEGLSPILRRYISPDKRVYGEDYDYRKVPWLNPQDRKNYKPEKDPRTPYYNPRMDPFYDQRFELRSMEHLPIWHPWFMLRSDLSQQINPALERMKEHGIEFDFSRLKPLVPGTDDHYYPEEPGIQETHEVQKTGEGPAPPPLKPRLSGEALSEPGIDYPRNIIFRGHRMIRYNEDSFNSDGPDYRMTWDDQGPQVAYPVPPRQREQVTEPVEEQRPSGVAPHMVMREADPLPRREQEPKSDAWLPPVSEAEVDPGTNWRPIPPRHPDPPGRQFADKENYTNMDDRGHQDQSEFTEVKDSTVEGRKIIQHDVAQEAIMRVDGVKPHSESWFLSDRPIGLYPGLQRRVDVVSGIQDAPVYWKDHQDAIFTITFDSRAQDVPLKLKKDRILISVSYFFATNRAYDDFLNTHERRLKHRPESVSDFERTLYKNLKDTDRSRQFRQGCPTVTKMVSYDREDIQEKGVFFDYETGIQLSLDLAELERLPHPWKHRTIRRLAEGHAPEFGQASGIAVQVEDSASRVSHVWLTNGVNPIPIPVHRGKGGIKITVWKMEEGPDGIPYPAEYTLHAYDEARAFGIFQNRIEAIANGDAEGFRKERRAQLAHELHERKVAIDLNSMVKKDELEKLRLDHKRELLDAEQRVKEKELELKHIEHERLREKAMWDDDLERSKRETLKLQEELKREQEERKEELDELNHERAKEKAEWEAKLEKEKRITAELQERLKRDEVERGREKARLEDEVKSAERKNAAEKIRLERGKLEAEENLTKAKQELEKTKAWIEKEKHDQERLMMKLRGTIDQQKAKSEKEKATLEENMLRLKNRLEQEKQLRDSEVNQLSHERVLEKAEWESKLEQEKRVTAELQERLKQEDAARGKSRAEWEATLEQEKRETARLQEELRKSKEQREEEINALSHTRLLEKAELDRIKHDHDKEKQEMELTLENVKHLFDVEKVELQRQINSLKHQSEQDSLDFKRERERIERESLESKRKFDEQVAEIRLEAERKQARFKEELEEVKLGIEKKSAKQKRKLEEKASEQKRKAEKKAAKQKKKLEQKAVEQKQELEEEAAQQKAELERRAAEQKQQLDEQAMAQKLELEEKAARQKAELERKAAQEKQELEERVAKQKRLHEEELAEIRRETDRHLRAMAMEEDLRKQTMARQLYDMDLELNERDMELSRSKRRAEEAKARSDRLKSSLDTTRGVAALGMLGIGVLSYLGGRTSLDRARSLAHPQAMGYRPGDPEYSRYGSARSDVYLEDKQDFGPDGESSWRPGTPFGSNMLDM